MVFGDYVFARFTESRLHNVNYDQNQRKKKERKSSKEQEFANTRIWFDKSKFVNDARMIFFYFWYLQD